MTLATDRRLTLAEYLHYDDGRDGRYELVDGALKPTTLGTGKHGAIIRYLTRNFDGPAEQLVATAVVIQGAVGIQSPRGTRWDTCRIPDITVLPIAQWDDMQNREAVIRLNETPPRLVVEVVSPSTAQDDYRAKHSEYEVLDIPEYWIVDPEQQLVLICLWVDGRYQDSEFRGEAIVASSTFPTLQLSVAQILAAGQ